MIRVLAFIASMAMFGAQAGEPQGPVAWKEGTHYVEIAPSQPRTGPGGKIDVIEFFWYGCEHCKEFEPHLVKWLAGKPADVAFTRVPVAWPALRTHARLFYTLKVLHREDLHTKVFAAMSGGNPLVGSNDSETLRLQSAFARANGISEKEFQEAYRSHAVELEMEQAAELTTAYKVTDVPSILVAGKYVSNDDLAGSKPRLIEVLQYLVDRERASARMARRP